MFNNQLKEDLERLKQQVFIGYAPTETLLSIYYGTAKPLKFRDVIKSIESRLSKQEKMNRMILAHLGIEYAKITEETATGKQEKEVLRRVKTIKK